MSHAFIIIPNIITIVRLRLLHVSLYVIHEIIPCSELRNNRLPNEYFHLETHRRTHGVSRCSVLYYLWTNFSGCSSRQLTKKKIKKLNTHIAYPV